MPLEKDTVPQASLVTEKPVTDVTKNKKQGRAEMDFNVAVGIIGVSWLLLFLLVYSLRRYNI